MIKNGPRPVIFRVKAISVIGRGSHRVVRRRGFHIF
jgi:hypothetical protein